jgi:tetratricopeptide (TPR) repeat protein/regulation of enolase protein 1 (concanavalin A-like superfamily)
LSESSPEARNPVSEVTRSLAESDGADGNAVPLSSLGDEPNTLTFAGSLHLDVTLGDRVGPFELTEELGRGGQGAVFRGRRVEDFEQWVAIKVLAGRAGEAAQQALRRERELIARFQHPGIARLHDGGTTAGGLPWYAMELIDGVRLDRHCRDRSLSVTRRIELLIEIARAVQFAHERLVVHCDLKPSNLLVDRDGRPKVLDFGIARSLDGEPGDRRAGGMTPQYASPEQWTGEPVSPATDVYALGIILHELIVGRRPFAHRETDLGSLRGAVLDTTLVTLPDATTVSERGTGLRSTPIPLAEVSSGRRRELQAIISRALARQTGDRYPTAGAFADDLEALIRNQPVAAMRGGRGYRTRKFLVRNGWLSTAVAFAAFALIGGTAASLRSAAQARAAAERTREANRTLDDRNVELRRRIIEVASQRGRFKEVLENVEDLLRRSPDDPELLLLQAQMRYRLDEIPKARALVTSLLQRPDLGRWRASAQLLDAEMRSYSGSDPLEFEASVREAMKGELTRADRMYCEACLCDTALETLKKFEQAVELDPFHLSALTKLALVQLTLGRLSDMERTIASMRRHYPEAVIIDLLEINLRVLQGRPNEALALADGPRMVANQSEAARERTKAGIRFLKDIIPQLEETVIAGARGGDTGFATRTGWLTKLPEAFKPAATGETFLPVGFINLRYMRLWMAAIVGAGPNEKLSTSTMVSRYLMTNVTMGMVAKAEASNRHLPGHVGAVIQFFDVISKALRETKDAGRAKAHLETAERLLSDMRDNETFARFLPDLRMALLSIRMRVAINLNDVREPEARVLLEQAMSSPVTSSHLALNAAAFAYHTGRTELGAAFLGRLETLASKPAEKRVTEELHILFDERRGSWGKVLARLREKPNATGWNAATLAATRRNVAEGIRRDYRMLGELEKEPIATDTASGRLIADKPHAARFAADRLELTAGTPKVGRFPADERGPRLERDVAGDFIAWIRVGPLSDPGPVRGAVIPYRSAGFVLRFSDNRFVRVEREYRHDAGRPASRVRFDGHHGKQRTDHRGLTIAADQPIWLRIERLGSEIRMGASDDGAAWRSYPPMPGWPTTSATLEVSVVNMDAAPMSASFEGLRFFKPTSDNPVPPPVSAPPPTAPASTPSGVPAAKPVEVGKPGGTSPPAAGAMEKKSSPSDPADPKPGSSPVPKPGAREGSEPARGASKASAVAPGASVVNAPDRAQARRRAPRQTSARAIVPTSWPS